MSQSLRLTDLGPAQPSSGHCRDDQRQQRREKHRARHGERCPSARGPRCLRDPETGETGETCPLPSLLTIFN